MHVRTYLVLVAVSLLGCDRASSDAPRPPAGTTSAAAAAAAAPDSASAARQLARFLARSVETAPRSAAAYDSVADVDCLEPAESTPAYWVAAYRVLSVVPRGDSADALAEVTTVAEQVQGTATAYESVVRARVRTDTLRWLLTRGGGGGGGPSATWRVCGLSADGHDLGGYGRPDNVRYEPAGTSRATLLARIDSIRRAR